MGSSNLTGVRAITMSEVCSMRNRITSPLRVQIGFSWTFLITYWRPLDARILFILISVHSVVPWMRVCQVRSAIFRGFDYPRFGMNTVLIIRELYYSQPFENKWFPTTRGHNYLRFFRSLDYPRFVISATVRQKTLRPFRTLTKDLL